MYVYAYEGQDRGGGKRLYIHSMICLCKNTELGQFQRLENPPIIPANTLSDELAHLKNKLWEKPQKFIPRLCQHFEPESWQRCWHRKGVPTVCQRWNVTPAERSYFHFSSLKWKSHLQRTAHTPNIAATATTTQGLSSCQEYMTWSRSEETCLLLILFFCLSLPFFTPSFSSTTSPQSSHSWASHN